MPTASPSAHNRARDKVNRVILFKTPASTITADHSSDPYHIALSSSGLEPTFVPVLQESFDTRSLEGILRDGAQYDGVIVTSRRGAEGWIRAAWAVRASTESSSGCRPDWSQSPLHTVGQTARDLLRSSPSDLEHLIPAGEGLSAKSASVLVPILLTKSNGLDPAESAQASETAPKPKRYLLVRGDKSMETIQRSLGVAGHTVDEVEVYRTECRDDLSAHILEALVGSEDGDRLASVLGGDMEISGGSEDHQKAHSSSSSNVEGSPYDTTWLAFFSPSSSAFVLPLLPSHISNAIDIAADSDSTSGSLTVHRASHRYCIFAIGETTRSYLDSQGVRVDAVADTPDAEGLVAAIQRSSSSHTCRMRISAGE